MRPITLLHLLASLSTSTLVSALPQFGGNGVLLSNETATGTGRSGKNPSEKSESISRVLPNPPPTYTSPGTNSSGIFPTPGPVACYTAANQTRMINAPACNTLLTQRLPAIMDIDGLGLWSHSQTYRWDLGNDSAGFAAGSCVLEIATYEAPVPGARENFTQFTPRDFIDVAMQTVLPACKGGDGYGGQMGFDIFLRWYVKITTVA